MQYKIVVDKQPMTNPSTEKKEYIIDIEELRAKGNIHDSLMFEIDKTYVIRRLKLSEYYVLNVLEEPIIEALESVNIELFEGDNYIYLIDMTGNKFYAEYLIKNEFNDVFATRKEMNSAIDLTMQQITIAVNQKFTDYSTTEEMNAAIDLRANEINAEVEKKVDEETITGAYLILKINGDTSEAKLNADKIELSANDILNLLAGNTINLTSKNIVISSTNFNVDKNGNMTCNNANVSGTITSSNATITGGKIKVSGVGSAGDLLRVENSNNSSEFSYIQPVGAGFVGSGGRIDIVAEGDSSSRSNIDVRDSDGISSIYGSEIRTPKLTQTSLESIKKNISKFNKHATDIINNSDIYEYNLKSDKDTDKKLIGFIIGNNYKTPTEVISKTGQAIEHGSAIGILWKAVQELSARVEQLEKEVQHD